MKAPRTSETRLRCTIRRRHLTTADTDSRPSARCTMRRGHLTAIDILADPSAAADACQPARRKALAALTTAAATLAATEPESAPDAEWTLTIEDLIRRTGKSRRWLFEHSKDLPFVRRLTARTLVGDAARLNSWLERKR
jgi:hypothetical protein